MPLSTREQVFVEEYLICWNATEAARRAGYKNPNKIGPRKLVEVGIKAAVAVRISELKATADETLLRLASHSRGSIEDFMAGDSVSLDKARALGKMHLAKKVRVTTTTVSKPSGEDIETHYVELELYDAQAATVQLARILGQFVERVEVYDWRKEAQEIGVDPDRLVDNLFAKVKDASGNS
jgi:phage terminase small subunit